MSVLAETGDGLARRHALAEINGTLTLENYHTLGGIKGAVEAFAKTFA